MKRLVGVFIFVLCAAGLCGCRKPPEAAPAEIAVTSSYLYGAVRDVCGEEMTIFCVVPPGMCPGHFDLKPSEAQRLLGAKLLLAFDFQIGIGDILPADGSGPALQTVTAPEGLCVPASYLSVVRETAAILSAAYPARAAMIEQRVEAIAARMGTLEAECAAAIETLGAKGAIVLTSRHQAVFAEWLGLAAAGTFAGSEAETVANVNTAIQNAEGRSLRWIIANQQEGTRLAEALAERLGAPVAVFSNFPATFSDAADMPAFDAMVRENIRRLGEASR